MAFPQSSWFRSPRNPKPREGSGLCGACPGCWLRIWVCRHRQGGGGHEEVKIGHRYGIWSFFQLVHSIPVPMLGSSIPISQAKKLRQIWAWTPKHLLCPFSYSLEPEIWAITLRFADSRSPPALLVVPDPSLSQNEVSSGHRSSLGG